MGSASVFIGGKPAARMGDSTAHGGVITGGSATVFIGDVGMGSSNTPPFLQTKNKFTEKQNIDLKKALDDQAKMLQEKKAELEKWDESAKANFKKAFGTTDESARKMMQERINKMIQLNSKITADKFLPAETPMNKPGLFAYVYPKDPEHKVYLGEMFWKAPSTGIDSKAGTLSHEMSHFRNVGSTVDHGANAGTAIYGLTDSRQLAIQNSASALKHADSFQYFLENAK